jgi:hypothetical protein
MQKTFILVLGLFLMGSLFFTSCKVQDYESNARPISHNTWDSLVQKYVSEEGNVNYKGFIADSTKLNKYLALLSANHPNEKFWTKEERLAYWINAYNAFTVKLIVDNYPVPSIKDIKNGIPFVNTVWDIKFIHIEDATYDLNNIEHGIIRPKFNEPRIHFAVNCASQSCPKLANYAFTADKLDEQLDQAARSFINGSDKNQISKDEAKLSKIFSWYGGDFKKNSSLIEFINQYSDVKINAKADIDYLDYDWSLNE